MAFSSHFPSGTFSTFRTKLTSMNTNLPVGSIILFPGVAASPNQSPVPNQQNLEAQGWMICDGRSLAINIYPQLYNVIGTGYGGHDDCFDIPDYRTLTVKAPTGPPAYYIIKFF
jgi:hypothetical protein